MAYSFNSALHRFALFTAACTFVLVVAGALVTSNHAGLAVPDWPSSFGHSWFSTTYWVGIAMKGGILYEHGHRMIATFVGMLTIVLAVWLQRTDPRRWMRRLGWLALAAVIAQGVLGGLTVLFFLPPPISISHASLAQLFFCTTVGIAVFTSRWWMNHVGSSQAFDDSNGEPNGNLNVVATGGRLERRRSAHSDAVRNFAVTTAVVVFVQLVLGAAFRHQVLGILPHIVWAAVVLAFSVMLSRRIRQHFSEVAALRKPAKMLAALVGTQILLGVGAYLSRVLTADAPQPMPLMVGFTVAHVAVGALTLAASVVTALCCFRVLPPAEQIAVAAETCNTDAAAAGALRGSAS